MKIHFVLFSYMFTYKELSLELPLTSRDVIILLLALVLLSYLLWQCSQIQQKRKSRLQLQPGFHQNHTGRIHPLPLVAFHWNYYMSKQGWITNQQNPVIR